MMEPAGSSWISQARICDKQLFQDLWETVLCKLILNKEEPQGQNYVPWAYYGKEGIFNLKLSVCSLFYFKALVIF